MRDGRPFSGDLVNTQHSHSPPFFFGHTHAHSFVIRRTVVRKDLIQTLPLPRRLLDYLSYTNFFSEQVESDSSQVSGVETDTNYTNDSNAIAIACRPDGRRGLEPRPAAGLADRGDVGRRRRQRADRRRRRHITVIQLSARLSALNLN